MSNLAHKIYPVLDKAEDEIQFQVEITVRCFEHDCHVSYAMSELELSNPHFTEIVRSLKYRLQDFIKEKLNAPSDREKSTNKERLLN